MPHFSPTQISTCPKCSALLGTVAIESALMIVCMLAAACSAFLPTVAIVSLLMTACTDPGIIPRRQPDEEYLEGRKPRWVERPACKSKQAKDMQGT